MIKSKRIDARELIDKYYHMDFNDQEKINLNFQF